MAFRKSKWIPGTHGEQPVGAAARSALRLRLDSVWHYLPLAALAPHEDVEHVHQLRVATRRAAAALRTFRRLLPEGRRCWIKRRLRQVRQGAGPARDLDVLEQRLVATCGDNGASGLRSLLDLVRRERAATQPALVEAYDLLRRKRFSRKSRKLARKARWRDRAQPEPSLAAFAKASLREAVAAAFSPVRQGFVDYDALHRFRIAIKRLRYAMELFAGAFPQDFRRDVYRQVAELQQMLGEVNDHHTTAAAYGRWRHQAEEPLAAALDREIEREQQALVAARNKFDAWWFERGHCLEEAILRFLDGGPAESPAERASA
jgi:CHAD domain-containing protein